MTPLQDKLAQLRTDTSISSRIRGWIIEATSRIEDQTSKTAALEARVKALESKPAPVPIPPPIPTPPPLPTPLPPAAPVGPFTVMDGGGTQAQAIFDYNPSGKFYEKLSIKNYLYYGLGAMRWPSEDIPNPVTIRDCIIENVSANPPQSRDGTAEACLWIGNKARVSRVKLRNGAWMGMWTGASCFGSVFEDIEISDCPGVGLYIEHETKRAIFRRCKIAAKGNAVNIEWWYGGKGSNSILFEDCEFHSDEGWGMFVDAGTYDVAIRNCKFTGKNGLALPSRLVNPGLPNSFDKMGNDFSGVTGVKTKTHDNAIG